MITQNVKVSLRGGFSQIASHNYVKYTPTGKVAQAYFQIHLYEQLKLIGKGVKNHLSIVRFVGFFRYLKGALHPK